MKEHERIRGEGEPGTSKETGVNQQIDKKEHWLCHFSAETVVKSADLEEQIVWESRDQCGKQTRFDSTFTGTDVISMSW